MAPPRPRWRALAAGGLVVCCSFGIVGTQSATAQSTEAAIAEAEDRIDELQRQADELALRYAQATERSAMLEDQMAELEARISLNRQSLRELRSSVRDRAIDWYSASTTPGALSALDGRSVMDAARREVILDVINDADARTMDSYRATRQDLTADLTQLTDAQDAQRALLESLADDASEIDQKLTEVSAIRDELERRYAAELEARRRAEARAEAERRARLAEQRREANNSGGDGGDTPEPTVPDGDDSTDPGGGGDPEPVSGNLGVAICPIQGPVTFTDTWGDARSGGRSHQGVDLLSPAGTPNVAVTSGTIEQDYGDRQGNGVFLYGDNGNTYYYFHLSAYEGGERHVAQGEVIGYVGSTGASGANHTHFEIHPGGGSAVNPYPYVSQVC